MGPLLKNMSAREAAKRPQFWVRFLFSEIPMPKFFDRSLRGGPILGSAWQTPKWVRRYESHHCGPGGFGGDRHIVLICIFTAC